MFVATWNVLHRIHAENWGERPIERYASEEARIAAVASRVLRLLDAGSSVVALQEVSGDQIAAIQELIPADVAVFAHRYGRVPSLRDGRPSPLRRPEEYLVTLVRGASARPTHAEDSRSDKGKGLLAVELDGALIVNAHLGKREPGAEQLARVVEVVSGASRAIALGDFNADHAALRPSLPAELVLADAIPDTPTRIVDAPKVGRWIDHCLVRGGRAVAVEVIDDDLPSDHTPVRFRVEWGD